MFPRNPEVYSVILRRCDDVSMLKSSTGFFLLRTPSKNEISLYQAQELQILVLALNMTWVISSPSSVYLSPVIKSIISRRCPGDYEVMAAV